MKKAVIWTLVCILVGATISSAMVESNDVNMVSVEDTNPPEIHFISPTLQNGSHTVPPDSIEVALSSSDESTHYTLVDFNHDLDLWLQMEHINNSSGSMQIVDSSSYHHDATAYGDAMPFSQGRVGQAFSFDGDRDYLHIDTPLLVDNTFSFGGWVKWDVVGQNPWPEDCPMMHVNDYQAGHSICARSDWGNKIFAYWEISNITGDYTTPYQIETGVWYHVLLVQNETNMSFYVNGNFIDDCSASPDMGTQFLIGGFPYSGGFYWFDGAIDEVVIFNRALSAGEIRSLYDASANQYVNTFTELSADNYTYTGYAVDQAGNKKHTETRWRQLLNDPPSVPTQPQGPDTVIVGYDCNFTTQATDPEGHQIQYGWGWGDGSPIEWTDFFGSGEQVTTIHVYNQVGDYEISVIAKDLYRSETCWSIPLTVNVINNPPLIPDQPDGPELGTVGYSYNFSTCAIDPDYHQIRYGWDWNGDLLVDEWSDYYPSGVLVNSTHIYYSTGMYEIRVIVNDSFGAMSNWSDPSIIEITNDPPTPPTRPEGPCEGVIKTEYLFSTASTDSDIHQIRYGWDWDDGSPVEWTDYYDSGITATRTHLWNTPGNYSVRVTAEDSFGLLSNYSEPLFVNIKAPMLEIGDISGGLFRLKTTLKNTGDIEATDVNWRIDLEGNFIFSGHMSQGDPVTIAASEELIVQSDLILGLGRTKVTMTAEVPSFDISVSKTVDAILFLFYIVMK